MQNGLNALCQFTLKSFLIFAFIKRIVCFESLRKISLDDDTLIKLTRAVRGSDYSPATALSEEKEKLVTENWKDREKKFKDYTKTTCTPSFLAENICKVSKQLVQNCKRSCTHKVPTVYTL